MGVFYIGDREGRGGVFCLGLSDPLIDVQLSKW